jgi:hypothetical protein
MDQNSGEGFEGLVAIAAFHRSRLMFLLMLEGQVSINAQC